MPDYYKILNVSSKASAAEIKSAFRRLARKKHPDVNNGDERLTQEFSSIAEAYKILGDPQDRAEYDKKLLRAEFYSSNGEDSVFNSDNPHAKRMRQMAYEKRYNAIIDRMIADERRESKALQQIIFPVVALFVSTGFVATFKPLFWSNSSTFGKIILLGLFIAGVLHLLRRLYQGFDRYTYSSDNIHDSLLEDIDEETRPYSRFAGMSFLIGGIGVSLLVGLLVGNSLEFFTTAMMPRMFSHSLHLEFIFYPPIVVLLVDIMHSLAARFEQ